MVLYMIYRKNKTVFLEEQKVQEQIKADVEKAETIMVAEVQVIATESNNNDKEKENDLGIKTNNQLVHAQTHHCVINMEPPLPLTPCQAVKCEA